MLRSSPGNMINIYIDNVNRQRVKKYVQTSEVQLTYTRSNFNAAEGERDGILQHCQL